jgi:PAS domain S-box-containing protein
VDDRIDGIVIGVVDISAVKKAERTQQNYESFYTLFHSNPIPTLLTRLEDGVVMNANHAFLDYLGIQREDVVGQTVQEFNLGLNLHSKQRSLLTVQLLKDGGIRNFEEEIELPSGEIKTVLTSIQYIFIEEKDAIISTFIDITDRVQAERQIRKLTIDLTTAEQEERQRLSQILHDDLQQRIFAVKIQVENMEQAIEKNDPNYSKVDFQKLAEWLAEAINITRQLSADLSPLSLKGEEFPEVILWLVSQMKEQYGLEVKLDIQDGRIRLDNNLQLLLFHTVRELLFNVVKHSGKLEAFVAIRREAEDLLQIHVEDGGVGFEAKAVLQEGNSAHGLTNIYQRLKLFGCSLEIDSATGGGTRVTIDCPLDSRRPGS